ncbi:MAG: N-acetylmuramate alpha-1-phosphate uridylyltransferase MurU [Pseudomonadota bacterium]
MKAMILAAGRGERLRPLTDSQPKPMIEVGGKPLILHHIENLAHNGFKEIVINLAYLGDTIADYLGDGHQYGVSIEYSREDSALETAGGIATALPMLGEQPFIVVNGDIWTDYAFAKLSLHENHLAHLVMVQNPVHHPMGDFGLNTQRALSKKVYQLGQSYERKFTFSGIGCYHPRLFKNCKPNQSMKLAPLLLQAMESEQVSGEMFQGRWIDVGTPERLREAMTLADFIDQQLD